MKIYNEIPNNKNEKWVSSIVKKAVAKAIKEGVLKECEKVILYDKKRLRFFCGTYDVIYLEIDGERDFRLRFEIANEINFQDNNDRDTVQWDFIFEKGYNKKKGKLQSVCGSYTYWWKYYIGELFKMETLEKLAGIILKKYDLINDVKQVKHRVKTERDNLKVALDAEEYIIELEFRGEYSNQFEAGKEEWDSFCYTIYLTADDKKYIDGKKRLYGGRVKLEGHNQIKRARKDKRIRLGVNFKPRKKEDVTNKEPLHRDVKENRSFEYVLWDYEHRILRSMYYTNKAMFVNVIIENPNVIWENLESRCQMEDVENIYEKEDFVVEKAVLSEEDYLVNIIFPQPEATGLCYNIYLIFSKDFERQEYFCVQKREETIGNEEKKEILYLIAHPKGGMFENCGEIPFDQMEILSKCCSYYKTKYDLM